MPGSQRSVAITDAYRARLESLRDRAAVLAGRRIAAALMATEDLDAAFTPAASDAAQILALAQTEAVRLSDGYLAAYVTSETGEDQAPLGIEPDDYAGATADGRPLAMLLGVALIRAKIAIRNQRGGRDAAAAGVAAAVRVARTETMDAARRSLADATRAHPRVVGYRRVVSFRASCGACIALATGEIRRTDKALRIHASCRCTAEPVVDGVRERARRQSGREFFDSLTESEQDALFAGRGGAAKAELIRSGAVRLDELVREERNPVWTDTITEAPLQALSGGRDA